MMSKFNSERHGLCKHQFASRARASAELFCR
jgi:hypothetical protein